MTIVGITSSLRHLLAGFVLVVSTTAAAAEYSNLNVEALQELPADRFKSTMSLIMSELGYPRVLPENGGGITMAMIDPALLSAPWSAWRTYEDKTRLHVVTTSVMRVENKELKLSPESFKSIVLAYLQCMNSMTHFMATAQTTVRMHGSVEDTYKFCFLGRIDQSLIDVPPKKR